MTPKTIKCVDHEKQDTFSCKHEKTLKSMEFSKGDEQLCLLTVVLIVLMCLLYFVFFLIKPQNSIIILVTLVLVFARWMS